LWAKEGIQRQTGQLNRRQSPTKPYDGVGAEKTFRKTLDGLDSSEKKRKKNKGKLKGKKEQRQTKKLRGTGSTRGALGPARCNQGEATAPPWTNKISQNKQKNKNGIRKMRKNG